MTDDPYAFTMIEEDVVESSKSQWPSFYDVDKWLGRENHAILENRYAQIGMSEYCGLVSVWLVPLDVDDREVGLRDQWIASIRPRFEKFFSELVKVGTFSNGESVYQRRTGK